MVWTRALRPAVLPAAFGQDFFLAGYRVFTRLQEPTGRRLRGLRILRSATDKRSMVWSGNLMTGYNYTHVRVDVTERGSLLQVATTDHAGAVTLDVTLDTAPGDVTLPAGSPFTDWAAARRFAGPMPFTFSPETDDTMVVVEGSRQHWEPRPVSVHSWRVAMFDELPFRDATPVMANAFIVEHVDYHWKRGRLVTIASGAS